VVAGYSFGASTAPFAISGLPASSRELIEKVVLLGPTATTSFEFRLSQWLGSDAHDSAAVAPEVAKLAPLRVWCVHGAQDNEAQCPPLTPPSRVITLPGDHHFNDDYQALARLIIAPPPTR
jgi:type IV secretory pathway VirJ component